MKSISMRRVALGGAAVLAVVAAGCQAGATDADHATACVDKTTGVLRLIDPSKGACVRPRTRSRCSWRARLDRPVPRAPRETPARRVPGAPPEGRATRGTRATRATPGASGTPGAPGTPGAMGLPGTARAPRARRAPRSPGIQGDQGRQGDPGRQGHPGIQGIPGPTGPDSRFGTIGYTPLDSHGAVDCVLAEIILSASSRPGATVADGRLLAISQNTALFSLLGTTFGGNGTTTFALPDLRNCAAPNGLNYAICTEGIYPSRTDQSRSAITSVAVRSPERTAPSM